MTSKEIVEKTLSYQYPERVARSFGDSDFVLVKADVKSRAADLVMVGNGKRERFDERGNLRHKLDGTSKDEAEKPVLDDMSRIDDYELPDYSNSGDYKCVAEQRAKHPDKWLIGAVPGFAFGIARYILRLEDYLAALMLEKERVKILHNKIDVILEQMIRNYAAAGADCIFFPEDWGTQSQLFIRPELWYEEFFGRFQKLCSIAHQCGIKVFMHSCGQIDAIIPGLMKAGVDVLQFDQPDLYGIETIARYQEQGRITFWCPVDIQKTLQTRNEKIIRDKAREMLDKLWKGRGGFIAGYYPDNVAIGLDPKWQDCACQEFLKHGKRRS
jgi:uroporphyrinogen decarboxylase